jgi:hypothetical protein
MSERPNPVEHHAAASNLPRNVRGRVGQTTDPVPEGKKLDAEPKHHFPVEPAGHDVERAKAFAVADLPPEHTEALKKMNDASYRQHLPNMNDVQAGMDWLGTSTQANKKMDSRRRHGGIPQSDRPSK